MEIIFTPFMGLTLPNIITTSTIGTLPQDWALYINSNLVIFDAHDHSGSGKQISSVDLQTNTDIDINGKNILELDKVILQQVSFTTHQPNLFTNGTDLFFLAGNGEIAQITALGTIPSDVSGFFGDYAVSGANASFDGPSNTFQFFGAGASQNTKVKAQSLVATSMTDSLVVDVSTVMSSTMVLNAQKVTLKDPSKDFGNSVLVENPDITYAIGNVVGDGSPYITNPSRKSLNVPLTNANQIYQFTNGEIPTPVHGNSQYSGGGQNQETMTFVFESAPIKDVWLPFELATFSLAMVTTPTNLAIQGTTFNVISAKACVVTTKTLNTYSNFPIFWRLYVLNVSLDPETPSFSTAKIYFQNLSATQIQFGDGEQPAVSHFLRLVVKISLNYTNPAFFGATL